MSGYCWRTRGVGTCRCARREVSGKEESESRPIHWGHGHCSWSLGVQHVCFWDVAIVIMTRILQREQSSQRDGEGVREKVKESERV